MNKLDNCCAGGFTLVELLISIAVGAVLMAAVFSTFSGFVSVSARESENDRINADVKIALKLIEWDVMNAGFGLPVTTRVASHDNCNAGSEDFCKDDTDRFFVADGEEILRDVTDNGEVDGAIPAEYMTRVSNAKSSGNGYSAGLSALAKAGNTSIQVNKFNINIGEENLNRENPPAKPDDDIQDNKAFIASDGNKTEGHRTGSITGSEIKILSAESMSNDYAESSTVVPAIAWYVRKDRYKRKYPDGSPVYWLYRNQNRVIPNIEDFQVRYGYDAGNNGIQENNWLSVIPPPAVFMAAGTLDSETAFDFRYLKAVEITIRIKHIEKKTNKSRITDYQTIIMLRN